MVEPTTVNRALIIPNTGDLAGTWGSAALNPDFVAIDGMLGGFTSLSLSNANVTLSVPASFIATPSAGPTQSQNALITFTGTLTGNVTITFPMPGYYIVNNLCTVGSFAVRLASSSPGKIICAPPGEAVHIFCNGTDMFYVNLGRVGEYLDLATSTIPAWITQCTVAPYLLCDGTTFSGATFPTLNSLLGGTTLPDLRGRARFALNGGTGRVTTAGSGINGDAILSAGGTQAQTIAQANLPAAALAVTIPSGQGAHEHTFGVTNNVGGSLTPGSIVTSNSGITTTGGTTKATTNVTLPQLTGTAATGGAGTALPIMPPAQISGITLIRAG